MGKKKIQSELQDKLWKRLCNMLIEIEEIKESLSLYDTKINAGVRSEGWLIQGINGLSKSGIKLDRKILAEIAYDNLRHLKL